MESCSSTKDHRETEREKFIIHRSQGGMRCAPRGHTGRSRQSTAYSPKGRTGAYAFIRLRRMRWGSQAKAKLVNSNKQKVGS